MSALDKTEFASGAEATAHYYKKGYQTVVSNDKGRYMQNGKSVIKIMATGLLGWKVIEIQEGK
jgi:hypothetical protein